MNINIILLTISDILMEKYITAPMFVTYFMMIGGLPDFSCVLSKIDTVRHFVRHIPEILPTFFEFVSLVAVCSVTSVQLFDQKQLYRAKGYTPAS
jgi:hypothetical protein